MNEDVAFANTTLPLFFYELIEDIRRGPDVPKAKGFGSGPYSVSLPKDRRLQLLILLAELGSKLDTIDKHIGKPGRQFADPYIDQAITTFSLETGLPEEDIRHIINRPRAPGEAPAAPTEAAPDVAATGIIDP